MNTRTRNVIIGVTGLFASALTASLVAWPPLLVAVVVGIVSVVILAVECKFLRPGSMGSVQR